MDNSALAISNFLYFKFLNISGNIVHFQFGGEYPNISNSGVRHVTRRGRWVNICPCPSLPHCSVLSAKCTVHSAQCSMHTAKCTIHTALWCTLLSAPCKENGAQCTVYTCVLVEHNTVNFKQQRVSTEQHCINTLFRCLLAAQYHGHGSMHYLRTVWYSPLFCTVFGTGNAYVR